MDETASSIPIVRELKDLIVTTLDPCEIVLFGSYAKGDYSEGSDIDMLVITESEIGRFQRQLVKESLYDYPVKVDLLFYTRQEINEENKEYSFLHNILGNCISIYRKYKNF
jgi:uncharacterized protein